MTTPTHYPFAAAPDIIRSHQKDAYFSAVLLEQLSSLLRKLRGARVAHAWTTETKTLAELLYLGLTTFVGNRTLGEEYCDIVQVEDDSLRLPSVVRRAAYIFASVLVPYGLGRVLPALRRRLRTKLEARIRRAAKRDAKEKGGSGTTTTASNNSRLSLGLQKYLLSNLDTITSPAPVYAVSLAVFYFSGAYYQIGKRLVGLRYVFTRRIEPGEQRVGYEVLGVLLVLQLAVQGYLHAHSTLSVVANAGAAAGGSAALDHGVEVSLNAADYSANNALLFETPSPGSSSPSSQSSQSRRIAASTATPVGHSPRYDLADPATMAWVGPGRQQRKCTLCLEEMKEPAVTTCGHVFCWGCIGDWCRERPDCPLCRQSCLAQHVLPLRC
ncbi:Pex12 amino terminal region-domain-containing protein [Phyllosticta capitalensis]